MKTLKKISVISFLIGLVFSVSVNLSSVSTVFAQTMTLIKVSTDTCLSTGSTATIATRRNNSLPANYPSYTNGVPNGDITSY